MRSFAEKIVRILIPQWLIEADLLLLVESSENRRDHSKSKLKEQVKRRCSIYGKHVKLCTPDDDNEYEIGGIGDDRTSIPETFEYYLHHYRCSYIPGSKMPSAIWKIWCSYKHSRENDLFTTFKGVLVAVKALKGVSLGDMHLFR